MDAITEGSPINDPKKQPAAMRTLLGRTARDWWPEALSIDILHQGRQRQSDGRRFRLSQRVPEPGL